MLPILLYHCCCFCCSIVTEFVVFILTDFAALLFTIYKRLSFSHFIELLKLDTPLKRAFYEVEAIKNNWSVRDLQRAMNSMLYERTGLSTNKNAVLSDNFKKKDLKAENIFRNPYMLEFLGLEEKAIYTETDLEQAIIVIG